MHKHITSIKYGLLAGFLMSAVLVFFYVVNKDFFASDFRGLIYLPLIFLMVWGSITIRNTRRGYESVADAFLTTFIISFIATVMYDSTGYLFYKVVDPELYQMVNKKDIEAYNSLLGKNPVADAKIVRAIKEIQARGKTPGLGMQLKIYGRSFTIGAFFSVLIALFVGRGSDKPTIKTEV